MNVQNVFLPCVYMYRFKGVQTTKHDVMTTYVFQVKTSLLALGTFWLGKILLVCVTDMLMTYA